MTEARTRRPGTSRAAIAQVLQHPAAAAPRLIWVYAIAMGAFSGTMAILALFLFHKFDVGPDRIWIVFTYVGAISVVTRAGLLGTLVDKLGEPRLSRTGLVLLALGLGLLPFAPNYFVLAPVLALIPLGTAFTFPCVTAMLSHVISSSERGLYMGVQQTFGGVARVIVPLFAGFAYDNLGRNVPFMTSALLVAGAIVLQRGIRDPRRDVPVEIAPEAVA
jgi:MFS family permease